MKLKIKVAIYTTLLFFIFSHLMKIKAPNPFRKVRQRLKKSFKNQIKSKQASKEINKKVDKNMKECDLIPRHL